MLSITRDHARQALVSYFFLDRDIFPADAHGIRQLLQQLGCIQIDPLVSTGIPNHEQVILTRIDATRRDVFRSLNHYCFEHWCKERCFLPAQVFPVYLQRARLGSPFRTLACLMYL